MSTVICQGCGQAFAVPPGYSRNKIQCPGCGVICQVPAGGGGEAPSRPAREAEPRPAREPEPRPTRSYEDDAAAWLSDPEPAPPPAPRRREEPVRDEPRREAPARGDEPIRIAPPVAEAAPEPEVRKPKGLTVTCRRCGRAIDRQRECPYCDVGRSDEPLPEEPETAPEPTFPRQEASAPVAAVPPLSLELDEPAFVPTQQEEEDDDPDPYGMVDKDKPRCPKCRKDMEFGAVLCASCGFNLRTRKKAKRRYSPIARQWETDMTLANRLTWLGGFWAVHLIVTLAAWTQGNLVSAIVAFFPLTFIVAFILGTYDRVQILRDERGRVSVVKQWRFFFIPATPVTREVRGYEGVLIGSWNDSGIMEWFICFSMLFLGCVPALIWWYVAIYQSHHHVALAEDHGRPALTVYRGRSESQMHEIAAVLCDATGLQIRV